MDKTWMKFPRNSKTYLDGLKMFLDFAFSKENTSVNGMILCPCKTCKNGICLPREDVEVHLRCLGFIRGYTQWIAQGETSNFTTPNSFFNEPSDGDNMQEMLNDAFGVPYDDVEIGENEADEIEEPNSKAKSFYKLVDDSQQELWPGCKKFSKLSFLVRLYHIKCLGKISNKAFTMLLELLNEAFPEGVKLPKSNYAARRVIEELGLGYKKYDACPNDCTLFWGKDKNSIQCETCSSTRWVVSDGDPTGEKRKVPHKVLWHFPLKGRLQRLFMSSKTASFMRWHAENRTKDGNMRHPADSPAWQCFDYRNPEFAKDPRNVRLGLASDGFNPFKNMNVSHSTWPVILIPYNLPPWMCMKQPYFMMSLLIPGPSAPGNNIDIYLQPLVEELKYMWDVGIDTYDASCKQNFKMRASLLWTISDFPGYANLSGWSTKGKLACPVCNKNTDSLWLKNCGKHCYMGNRRFLEKNHYFRNDLKSFNGNKETRDPPRRPTGSSILADLEGFEMKFGKLVSNNPNLPFNWKKKSILFDLPYWKDNLLPHNLDVMHITKNVCESIIGTRAV
ncbi:uncharacterized protein LOC130990399 [Salvia miltiorrhiza]|uniref:uncharacterized protein LOC130990399 n=1 Tax=Salvia miltiorrhiza TaxID=226208 RepID=UPI0025ABB9EE|nr:uncharacterized protein LOC130990399 [Salvia miltiorrhiza]